jgi:hypothetical protein
MKMIRPGVKSFEIKRRTFEGKIDPSKNDCSLTSKYMPSYKYWLRIVFDNGQISTETKPTKQQCIDFVDNCRRQAGTEL